MAKLLEIFRSGKRTAMSGETLDFTEEAIAASAAAYDPSIHEAPLVVGHPTHDAPAYGWVAALESEHGSLRAEPTQIDATFQEWVNQGRYKKISASFYSPSSPQNPAPGVYYLRHVGFLGAMPPSVKGMRAIEFADGEEGIITVEFADQPRVPAGSPNGGEFAPKTGGRSTGKHRKVETPGLNEAAEVEIESVGKFKPHNTDLLSEGGMISQGQIEVNAYSKHTKTEDRDEEISEQYFFDVSKDIANELQSNPDLLKKVVAIHAKHVSTGGKDDFIDIPDTDYKLWSDPQSPEIPGIYTNQQYENFAEQQMSKEQELEQREQAIALRERAATLKEQELQFSEAIDGAIKEGRVLAAEKPAHLKRLKMLAAIPADNIADFAEGKADYSPTTEYIAELKNRPVAVNFSEFSGGEVPEATNDPKASARAIEKRVKDAKAEGRTLSFADADAEIRAEQNGAKN